MPTSARKNVTMLSAKAAGASKIIAIDIRQDKLALALELGAHDVVNTGQDGVVEAVKKITEGGVHLAIDAAGSSRAFDTAYRITRRDGTTIAAGMPEPDAAFALPHLSPPAEERMLKGSYMGSCILPRDIPQFLALFREGHLPIDWLMSRSIGFDRLNVALDRLDDGATVREILVP